MDPDSRLSILFVALLFVASAYLALTETAIASVSKSKIKSAADRGNVRAKRVMYILDHFDDAITTLLILTNICHIAAAAIITVIVTRTWGLSAVTLSTILFTIAMFFVGEMLPKSIGNKISEKASLTCSGLLVVLMKLCYPLSKILSGIGKLVVKHTKGEEEYSVTENELYDIIEDMAEEGAIDEERGELISSALQFGDVTVSSILTPRVDVAALNINQDNEKILEFIQNSNHSRILIYEETIDHVVGVLQIRKFLKKYLETHQIPNVREIMDEVFFVHQSMEIDELLTEMSKNKLNIAVVNDAYGGTLGVVTVEDILEEIVGEIWDEDDEIHEPIVQLSQDTYLVDGNETVLDTFDFMEYEDPNEEENDERFTNLLMADWVCEQFSQIPEQGDSFDYDILHVVVNKMDHNRILKISITRMKNETEDPGEEDRKGGDQE